MTPNVFLGDAVATPAGTVDEVSSAGRRAYPLFLLGLRLTVPFTVCPLHLAVPAWRARKSRPLITLIEHAVFGAGVLWEALR